MPFSKVDHWEDEFCPFCGFVDSRARAAQAGKSGESDWRSGSSCGGVQEFEGQALPEAGLCPAPALGLARLQQAVFPSLDFASQEPSMPPSSPALGATTTQTH